MIKEELKQKAEEYALEKCKECYMCNSEENGERLYCAKFESRKEGYIAGAEPREREIKSLGERCLQLQKDKGNLTDRVIELEQQIEKMKCCYNCKHSRTEYEHCKTDKHEKWEMKEK